MPTPDEVLDQLEIDLAAVDYDEEAPGALDRRHFLFFSLVSAAATSLGMSGTLEAQARARQARGSPTHNSRNPPPIRWATASRRHSSSSRIPPAQGP